MRLFKKIAKWIGIILLFPILYLIVAYISSNITVNEDQNNGKENIYLSSNGVHLDVILPIQKMDSVLLKDIDTLNQKYIAFGWGDENFYINTPTWAELKFTHACEALFMNSSTLMHVTHYKNKGQKWLKVKLTKEQLKAMNKYIINSFKITNGKKILLPGHSYGYNDVFYKANGSYTCFKTCNTWVNTAFLECNLKASPWTPFDWGLFDKYKLKQ